MTGTADEENVYDSDMGPLVEVAPRSSVKPLPGGLGWSAIGLGMIAGGIAIPFWISRGEMDSVVGFASVPLLLLGWVLATTLVRRIRAASDERVHFRVGPEGVSVGEVGSPRLRSLFLSYGITVHEFTWEDVKTWYSHKLHVQGSTVSSIVFEGVEGWKLSIDTLYFAGDCEAIAAEITEAMEGTDLPADEDEEDEEDLEEQDG